MYAAIRQGKAKTGMAEDLMRRIKEGAIMMLKAHGILCGLCTRRHRDCDQCLQRLRGSGGGKQACACLDRAKSRAPARWPNHRGGRPGDRPYVGIAR